MKKVLIVLFLFLLNIVNVVAQEEAVSLPSQIGVVENVKYVDLSEGNEIQTKQTAEVRLLKGDLKNELVLIDNVLTGNPYYDIKLNKGTKVVMHVEDEGDGLSFSIEDIQRSNVLVWLMIIFCGLLVYVGKTKGLCSLVSIVLATLLITNLLSPIILTGFNPVLATVFVCLLATSLTMFLVGGFNRKSTSAALGCFLSLICAGFMAFLTVKFAHLNGFVNENVMFLYSAYPQLDFVGIAISTMLLATLGAVMDVAMSIASTINEIYLVDNTKTVKELFKSGMNVGRDIIGTMANTLILVYLGTSLPLVLLASNIDMQKFFNLNQVVTEIASALIGSSAIVICVPITAIIASELIKNMPVKTKSEEIDL